MSVLKTLYDQTIKLAGSRHALVALAIVSFLESWIFPIPPDVMLIPMVIARPDRAFLIAGVCTAASVAGGLMGYIIGSFLFEELGQSLIAQLGLAEGYAQLAESYRENGFWAVFAAGFTPMPYKIVTILSGALQLSVPLFIVASIVGRGLRFFLVAALLQRFGPSIRRLIEKRLGLATLIACLLLLVAVFLARSL